MSQTVELTWCELSDEDRGELASELLEELNRLRDERREHLAYLAKEDLKADLIHI